MDMNILKRCVIYIKRNWGKSLLFGTLVYILTTLFISAIITSHTITLTQQQVRRQIPICTNLIQMKVEGSYD